MKLSRIIIAGALMLAAPTPVDAQFLNKLGKFKQKTEEKIKKGKDKLEKEKNKFEKATGINVPDISGGDNSSQQGGVGRSVGGKVTDDATSGTSYKKSDNVDTGTWRGSSAMPAEEDLETPEDMKFLHASTFGDPFRHLRNTYHTPRETSSTVHLVIDDDHLNPSFSDFYDGAAYVYFYNGAYNAFYINERGEKLFDTPVHCDGVKAMPRFYKGRVIETPDRVWSKEDKIKIRDKQGNVIKEFNAQSASPYFVNGIAALEFQNRQNFSSTIRFVDIDGNFILEDLNLHLTEGSIPGLIENAVREEKEGLIAFPAYDAAKKSVKWGFRDASGKVVIKPKWDAVLDFNDGMAAFFVYTSGFNDGKWGFIDKTGREVIPASFSIQPSNFDSGLARVLTKNDDAYLIDKNGKKVRGPFGRSDKEGGEIYVSPVFNGNTIVEYNYEGQRNVFCLVDRSGNRKAWFRCDLPLSLTTPIGFIDGKLYVKEGYGRNLWMVNPDNFNLEMDALDNPFINGLSRYTSNAGPGYIDENLNYVIKFEKNEF